PGHSASCLRAAQRRVSAAQNSHLHAASLVAAPWASTEQGSALPPGCECIAIAVDMMDNASALPTCPQRQQQQQKQPDSKLGQNHPHDFTMKLYLMCSTKQRSSTCL